MVPLFTNLVPKPLKFFVYALFMNHLPHRPIRALLALHRLLNQESHWDLTIVNI